MARLRFLDCIDRKEANCVDAELFELVLLSDFRLVALFRGFDRVAGFLCCAAHATSGEALDYTRRFTSEIAWQTTASLSKARRFAVFRNSSSTSSRRSSATRHCAAFPLISPSECWARSCRPRPFPSTSSIG